MRNKFILFAVAPLILPVVLGLSALNRTPTVTYRNDTQREDTLYGKVVERRTNLPVPGVIVTFLGNARIQTLTNYNGEFVLRVPKITAKSIRIQASCVGFNEKNIRIRIPMPMDSIKIRLEESVNADDFLTY